MEFDAYGGRLRRLEESTDTRQRVGTAICPDPRVAHVIGKLDSDSRSSRFFSWVLRALKLSSNQVQAFKFLVFQEISANCLILNSLSAWGRLKTLSDPLIL